MNLKSQFNTNALAEARAMLTEPSKDTKRKILLSVNGIFIATIFIQVIVQLIEFGKLPDPTRDTMVYGIGFCINFFSFIYNLQVILGKRQNKSFWDTFCTSITIAFASAASIVFVHFNPNRATSLLEDFGLSVIMLFVIGTVVNRKAAIVWFVIILSSLFISYKNIGSGFEYYLMSPKELTELKTAALKGDTTLAAKYTYLEKNKLKPLPVELYVIVWVVFTLMAFMVVFYESDLISRILKVIPSVIERINIASEEKNLLENENMRMGLELDVAKRIQLMVLPHQKELDECLFLEMTARMDPATEVGGDFYEVLLQEDGSVIVAIGDVTDHGLQSGLVMLMAQSVLRTVLDDQKVLLPDALARTNTIIYRNVRHRMDDHRNLTLSLAKITETDVTICGQHEHLLIYRHKTGIVDVISTIDLGIYVGLIEDISSFLTEATYPFDPQDVIIIYTDGLTEAENMTGEMYGEKRLISTIEKHAATHTSKGLLNLIYDDVYGFIDQRGLLDDVTLLIIKRK